MHSSDPTNNREEARQADAREEPPKARTMDGPMFKEPKENAIFVLGYDKNTTEEEIREHCGKAGTITGFELFRKGAILTFSSDSEAENAVSTLHKTRIDGKKRYINVKRDRGQPDKKAGLSKVAKEHAIFMIGFDKNTTAEDLRHFCAKAGTVTEVEFTGHGRAIVSFASDEEADSAVAGLNDTRIEGNRRNLFVKRDMGPQ